MASESRGGAERYDVAVVGGGPAGFAAAIAAADLGARTILLEARPTLGGNATGAFVHTICGLYPPVAAGSFGFVNPGLPARVAAALQRAGAAGEVEEVGRVRVLPTDPAAMVAVLMAECARRPSLEVRLDTRLEAAVFGTESELSGVGPDGPFRLTSATAIDASGTAVAAAVGGAAVVRASDAERQLPSYIVRLSGVPAEDTVGYGRLRLTVAVARATRRDGLTEHAESVLLRPVPGSDDAYLTLNLSRDLVVEEARTPGVLETTGRQAIEAAVHHLRANRPGYTDCRVVAWPGQVGQREGARLRGRVVIEAEPLLAGLRSDEEVALSSWPIELWHDHRGASYQYPEGLYGIPLGALISEAEPRLGVAGRCLSASHEALGALRVIGTALATGEAIGIAAALAADRGAPLTEVAAHEVRRACEALG